MSRHPGAVSQRLMPEEAREIMPIAGVMLLPDKKEGGQPIWPLAFFFPPPEPDSHMATILLIHWPAL